MTSGSDQQADTAGLSATSRRMLQLRDAVFAEWEARVRATLDKAGKLAHPILIDTLPVFYDNIARALTPDYPRLCGTDGSTVAAEHGSERARITTYDLEALIGEHQLFRWTIFDVLAQEGVALSSHEARVINASIDAGVQAAVGGFVLAHNVLRERFAAALTHDLRGPLSVMSAALELIMIVNDPAKIKTVASRALENVGRMDTMLQELLDTMSFHSGRQLSLQLTCFGMHEVIREVQLDTVALHGTRVQAIAVPVQGWWDRQAIKRALENILGNALKYGREGAPVIIKCSEAHERVVLSVHNEGDPIPLCEQETIFQMYRRAEAAGNRHQRGWGVGLAYVRAVAESHGGSISVDSTAERGTTFVIDIPSDCRPFKGAPTVA